MGGFTNSDSQFGADLNIHCTDQPDGLNRSNRSKVNEELLVLGSHQRNKPIRRHRSVYKRVSVMFETAPLQTCVCVCDSNAASQPDSVVLSAWYSGHVPLSVSLLCSAVITTIHI